MVLVQLLPSFLVMDVPLGGMVVFLDRAALVCGLVLYAAWLIRCSHAPDWAAKYVGLLAAVGMTAIFIESRPVAIPLIWCLQFAILVGLAAWAYRVRRDRWLLIFVGMAAGFHAVGTLTFYPVCQIGMGGLYIPPDNFRLACNQVIGPLLSGLLFASAGLAWATARGAHAIAARRP
jgi:hypothetical protein